MTDPDLWTAFGAVTRLRFEARCLRPPEWNGSGAGKVTVERVAEGVLLFHESGRWTLPDGRRLPFSNVFRWTLLPDDGSAGRSEAGLRLEHLRFGLQAPVHLFDMRWQAPGRLVSLAPHRCGADRYAGELRWTAHRVELDWYLSGPRKDGTIRYVYQPS